MYTCVSKHILLHVDGIGLYWYIYVNQLNIDNVAIATESEYVFCPTGKSQKKKLHEQQNRPFDIIGALESRKPLRKTSTAMQLPDSKLHANIYLVQALLKDGKLNTSASSASRSCP